MGLISFCDGTHINFGKVNALKLTPERTRQLEMFMYNVFNVINAIEDMDYEISRDDLQKLFEMNNNLDSTKLYKHFLEIGLDIE